MADNQNKKITDFVYTSADFFGDTSGLGAFTPVVAGEGLHVVSCRT